MPGAAGRHPGKTQRHPGQGFGFRVWGQQFCGFLVPRQIEGRGEEGGGRVEVM